VDKLWKGFEQCRFRKELLRGTFPITSFAVASSVDLQRLTMVNFTITLPRLETLLFTAASTRHLNLNSL
jgi:hypothetical protein